MVLEFPIMADYCVLELGKGIVYATHGHHFNEEHLPPLHKGDPAAWDIPCSKM